MEYENVFIYAADILYLYTEVTISYINEDTILYDFACSK
jgi:hypothetical protein